MVELRTVLVLVAKFKFQTHASWMLQKNTKIRLVSTRPGEFLVFLEASN